MSDPETLKDEVWRTRIRDTVVALDPAGWHVWWQRAWDVVPLAGGEIAEAWGLYAAHLRSENADLRTSASISVQLYDERRAEVKLERERAEKAEKALRDIVAVGSTVASIDVVSDCRRIAFRALGVKL